MQEVKGTEMNEGKKFESENYENIKPERGMKVEMAKEFWDNIFEKEIGERSPVSEIISNQDEMKELKSILGSELKDSKPVLSPDPTKWFEKDGKIIIEEKDGKIEWTYVNKEGIAVKYVDGYTIFPEETKHPYIGDISIGAFTGDREKDKILYKEKLYEEYGLTDIPTGYVLHHDSENGNLQLIKKEYHEEFTHQGGHSKYKEGTN